MAGVSIITIVLFFLYTWGLGYTATYFLKKPKNVFERNIMNVGLGLGLLPILSIILNFLRIPLDWRIYFIIALFLPFYNLSKFILASKGLKMPKFEIKLTKANLAFLIVTIIFLLTFFMYAKGAFVYPWFEDDDPWSHAVGVSYVANEKTGNDPQPDFSFPYMGMNYPPAYDIILGVLHQTSPDIMWTMKFFNALIISLGIFFLYFMSKRLFRNTWKAVLATAVLAIVPCYASHFIWAHSMFPTLMFVLIYSIDMIFDDKRYTWISTFLYASLLVIQPGHAIKLGVISVLYILVKSWKNWKFLLNIVYIHVFGAIVALLWWGKNFTHLLQARVNEGAETAAVAATSGGFISKGIGFLAKVFPPDSGTASRVYSFSDFFIARETNYINNPFGVGTMLYILLFVSLVLISIYLFQRLLSIKKEKNAVFIIGAILLGISFIIDLLLIGRYLSSVTGNTIFTSLYLDLFLMILVTLVYALLYVTDVVDKKKAWVLIVLLWLLFTFLGINSMTFNLPIGLMAFRFWMLFAIPLAILVAEGIWMLVFGFGKKFDTGIKIGIILLLIVGLFFTSGIYKYKFNTAVWNPGATFGASHQVNDYLWLKDNLPIGTKVFTLDEGHQYRLISMNMYSCEWCEDVRTFRKSIANRSIDEIYSFMKSHDYEYGIIGFQYGMKFGNDPLRQRLSDLGSHGGFRAEQTFETSVIFKVI